jgi:hypothetical protein
MRIAECHMCSSSPLCIVADGSIVREYSISSKEEGAVRRSQ